MSAFFFQKKYKEMKIPPPLLHLVLGSGLGGGLDAFEKSYLLSSIKKSQFSHWKKVGEIAFSDVKSLKKTSVLGHEGIYHYFIHSQKNRSLCIQAGRLHGYEGLRPEEVILPLKGPFLAGTKQFVLTNAAGALKPHISVGSLMIIKDHVNLTGKNPLYGPNPKDERGQFLGPRFLDMQNAYDPKLSLKLAFELKKQKLKVFKGIYLGLNGPSFETPAEIKLFQSWNLHAVGMSTVWEVIALRHMGAKLSALSLITNLGSGLEENYRTQSKVKKKKEKKIDELNNAQFLTRFQKTSKKVIEVCFNLACR